MTAVSARIQREHLIKSPSLRSQMIEWVLWRLRVKGRFAKTDGFRERVVKSRPTNPQPPRSFYRHYRVDETSQAGKPIFTISPRTATRGNISYISTVVRTCSRSWAFNGGCSPVFSMKQMRLSRFLSIHWHRNLRANESRSLSLACTVCFRTMGGQSSFLATVLAAEWRCPSVINYAMPGRRSQPNSCSSHHGSMSRAPIQLKQCWTDPIPFSVCQA
jgi:hypothetical protein